MSKLSEDMSPTFPSETILCKDCARRKQGKIGFKNAYCDAYADPPGKPNDILFENADCRYYAKERSK